MKRTGCWCILGLILAALIIGKPCAASTSLKVVSFDSNSLLVNSTVTHVIYFSTTDGLPAGSTVTATYPDEFDLTGVAGPDYPGYSVSGQTLTYTVGTRGVLAGGYSALQIDNIINPAQPGSYSVQLSTSNDSSPVIIPLQVTATGSTVTYAGIYLQEMSSLVMNTRTDYEFHFNATSGLPYGGTVTLVFPDEFDMKQVTGHQTYGSTIVSISGQTVTYSLNLSIFAGRPVNGFNVYNVVNPSTPGTYMVQISTSNDPIPVLVPITIIKPAYPLALTIAGTGNGTVTNITSGTGCVSGLSCPELNYDEGTPVVLSPVRNINSTFSGWSGDCTNTRGDCEIAMSSSKSVTATFTLAPKAMNETKTYTSIQTAYSEGKSKDLIRFIEGVVIEPLTAENNTDVTIEGGYSADYGTVSTETTIQGQVLIRSGTVRMIGIKIQ